jgi:hypothetical protein
MANGDAQLDAMLERLRTLPELARKAAPEVARVVERELERTIAAATTPEGEPWAPKKDGGGAALATAGKALRLAVAGSTIVVKITGHIARHHKGWGKGGVQRRVLPVRGIPAPMQRAIAPVLGRHFEQHMAVSP